MYMDISVLRDNWILIAFLAPMLWALVNIIDVYFVDSVYEDEWDGLVISGLFQLVPWVIIVPFIHQDFLIIFSTYVKNFEIVASTLAFAGGFFLICAYYFYFKALFYHNDTTLFQVLINLTAVIVPFLVFLFFQEILPFHQYMGIVVILAGVTILSLNGNFKGTISKKLLCMAMGGALLLSFFVVFERQAYSILREHGYGNYGFLIGLFFFSLGAAFSGGMFAFIKKKNPWVLAKKYYKVFFFTESLNFLGILTSQRAIDLAPSVSYVAAIVTFVPVFMLLFSFIVMGYSLTKRIKGRIAIRIYTEQLQESGIKVFATVVMAIGMYMISVM